MTSHPRGMPIELPLNEVVPLPQSGHQGLIVGCKEPHVLLLLSKLPLQTVTLERFFVSKSLIAQATKRPTLSLSLASMVHSLIETADECRIASVEAVIWKSYPSLPSRIPIRINLINSDSADDKSRLRNCSSMILSIASD